MADRKISELTAATSVTSADVVPIVQGSVTKKITADVLFSNIPTNIKYAGIKVETGTPDQIQDGAASLDTSITYLKNITTATSTVTLADGQQGQEKTFVCITHDTNDIDLIPSSLAGGMTKFTFTAIGQTAVLKFINTKWHVMSFYGATIV